MSISISLGQGQGYPFECCINGIQWRDHPLALVLEVLVELEHFQEGLCLLFFDALQGNCMEAIALVLALHCMGIGLALHGHWPGIAWALAWH